MRVPHILFAAAVLLLAASAASAQTIEVGGNFGRGPFQYDEDKLPGGRNVVGVEACIGCDRRGVFVEYAHWGQPDVNQDACEKYWHRTNCTTGYRSADTLASGVRFQGRPRGRVQMFGDLGGAFGLSRYVRSSGVEGKGHAGFAGAVGATVRFDQFYVRGAGQILILSGYYVGARATAGAGWKF
jgi:hypothetical protein